MKQFVERLKTDKAFAAEFNEFAFGKNAQVKESTRIIGEQLNEVVGTQFIAMQQLTSLADEIV